MIRDVLLAAGIVLTPTGQLSTGLPLGIGEMFLLGFIAVSAFSIVRVGRIEVNSALFSVLFFFGVFLISQLIGLFFAFVSQTPILVSSTVHDSMAYGLSACIAFLIAAQPGSAVRLRRTAWLIVGFANVVLATQLAGAYGLVELPGVDVWSWDRFQGWSPNPNQLALYCAVYFPLALHLAFTSSRLLTRVVGLCALVIPLYIGRITKSDTFLLTTVLTLLVFAALQLYFWLAQSSNHLRRQLSRLLVVGSLLLAVCALPYGVARLGIIAEFARSMTKGQGGEETDATLALRINLWQEAISTGAQSASLGFGPGAHLNPPPVTETDMMPERFEAHNTPLDLYTQGGLIAVLLLIWIVVSAASFAWRAGLYGLLALIISITVFSMTHLILRHPIVWFSLTACLLAGLPPARRRAA
jgi:O-antigen ligase